MGDAEIPKPVDARPLVLAVADESLNLDLITDALDEDFRVLTAKSGENALELLAEEENVAVIVSDYSMPGMNGAEFFARTLESHPETRRVIATGSSDLENIVSAVNSGRIHYLLRKPFHATDLLEALGPLAKSYQEDKKRLSNSKIPVPLSLQRTGKSALPILEVLPYKDILTGCLSHRAMQEKLIETVSAARSSKESFSLLHIDVDDFSLLNSQHGYQIGDQVLRELAGFLKLQLEDDSKAIARFGGQEFAILAKTDSRDQAVEIANNLCRAVEESEFGNGITLSLSIGISCFPDDASTASSLIQLAELAQIAAKSEGGGKAKPFSVEMGRNDPKDVRPVERFPSYHLRINQIVSTLRRDRTLACLFVDLSGIREVVQRFQSSQKATLFSMAGALLNGMKGKCLRQEDLICRTEDTDAFLCFLSSDSRSTNSLEELATRVQQELQAEMTEAILEIASDMPQITVGFGRVITNGILPPEQLVAHAVSEAKACSNLIGEQKKHRDKAFLQEIIVHDQLSPVYQPIVQLDSGDVFGYESLIRGPKDTLLETPRALFSIADKVRLTFELDRACFRSGLRGAVNLEPVHRLFVNLLPNSFYDSNFIEKEVSNLLDAAELTPANVVFEVSERLAIDDFSSFREALASYTAMGFGVAIDDVGTRHSNLETVMALKPHFIKISDVLTRGVFQSPVKREMLGSLQRIAEAIDAVVVAEGIENEDDLRVLCDLGVRYGQGFYMARPGPAFPRLRESVKESVRSFARPRSPITTKNSDRSPGCDDDMGVDSGVHPVEELTFSENEPKTRPKIILEDRSWQPLPNRPEQPNSSKSLLGDILDDLE